MIAPTPTPRAPHLSLFGISLARIFCGANLARRRFFGLFVRLRLRNPLHRNHFLAFGRIEDSHALGGAAGEAYAVDRHADDRAAVRNQHDLIVVADRESRDQAPDLGHFRDIGGADALAATARQAEIVGRRTLAVAV